MIRFMNGGQFLFHHKNIVQMMNQQVVDQQKGYEKVNGDGDIKKKDKVVHVDPLTGDKITTVTRTKVERANSRSSSSSGENKVKKSKHQYDNKVKNTSEGVEATVSEKHREGGKLENIKNKIHNMVNK